jgi:hypothetical protein
VLLLLLLRTAAATAVFVSNSSTSSDTTSLIAALQDPAVTRIVLRDDFYSVGDSLSPYMPGGGSGAINVTRCAATECATPEQQQQQQLTGPVSSFARHAV